MRKILPYVWGVFLAALAGFATLAGIAMVFGYIDDRLIYVLRILSAGKLSPTAFLDLLDLRLAMNYEARILSLAVTVWTFERWRQRQHQIQSGGR